MRHRQNKSLSKEDLISLLGKHTAKMNPDLYRGAWDEAEYQWRHGHTRSELLTAAVVRGLITEHAYQSASMGGTRKRSYASRSKAGGRTKKRRTTRLHRVRAAVRKRKAERKVFGRSQIGPFLGGFKHRFKGTGTWCDRCGNSAGAALHTY
jgi:hypothetical protein